jgi:argininosuccinate synthase
LRTRRRIDRIVLAYSGSANTTVAIPWLAERYGAEVVTVTLDLDQRTGLEATRDRALAAGAVRAHVVDACDEFARDFIVPALRAGAVTPEGDVLLAALSRPVIAKHLATIARLEEATAVAHGSERGWAHCFESLVRDLDPTLAVLSPVGDWTFAPAELVTYARARRLSIGVIDSSASTRSASSTPDYPATVDVAFEEGVPVALNGVSLPITELISSVETIAGAHGVGRSAPAAMLLHEAHRALQSCVTPPDIDESARARGADYAGLVAAGGWYSAARKNGDAFVASVQKHVTGTARLKLFKGHSEVVECRSPFALSAVDPRPTTDVVAARS